MKTVIGFYRMRGYKTVHSEPGTAYEYCHNFCIVDKSVNMSTINTRSLYIADIIKSFVDKKGDKINIVVPKHELKHSDADSLARAGLADDYEQSYYVSIVCIVNIKRNPDVYKTMSKENLELLIEGENFRKIFGQYKTEYLELFQWFLSNPDKWGNWLYGKESDINWFDIEGSGISIF